MTYSKCTVVQQLMAASYLNTFGYITQPLSTEKAGNQDNQLVSGSRTATAQSLCSVYLESASFPPFLFYRSLVPVFHPLTVLCQPSKLNGLSKFYYHYYILYFSPFQNIPHIINVKHLRMCRSRRDQPYLPVYAQSYRTLHMNRYAVNAQGRKQ